LQVCITQQRLYPLGDLPMAALRGNIDYYLRVMNISKLNGSNKVQIRDLTF